MVEDEEEWTRREYLVFAVFLVVFHLLLYPVAFRSFVGIVFWFRLVDYNICFF